MSYDPAFDDPWLKWRWAAKNAKAFHDEIERFLKSEVHPPFTTDKEYKPALHGFSVFVDWTRPSPDWWGLWLGDILHAYRSALDHLTWILVDRGATPTATLTETQRRRVYFPCAMTRNWFDSAISSRLPGCRRADVAVVRANQPYHRGKRTRANHPLAVLDALSNSEKHRTIQPVRRHQMVGLYRVTGAVDCEPRRIRVLPNVVVQVGAEIARIYVRRTGPEPDVEMKGDMAAAVAIREATNLALVLNEIQVLVAGILTRFSEPPPDLVARVAVPPP